MITYSPLKVTKASGLKEQFDESKLVKSLSSSGLSVDTASQVVDYLKRHLRKEISTQEIHSQVSDFLKQNELVGDYFNYGLKRAIMDLGPSGHPFETIVSDLLRAFGYRTEVGVIVLGKCVTHEVDIVASKDDHQYFIECKFHNTPGIKTDIQVGLYTYARFLDIKSAMENTHGDSVEHLPWLITNTKVTSEVFDYSSCVDMNLTTWLHPKGRGVHEMIIEAGLHPVTLLYSIPRPKMQSLIDKGIVTCARLKQAIDDNQVSEILNDHEVKDVKIAISKICRKHE